MSRMFTSIFMIGSVGYLVYKYRFRASPSGFRRTTIGQRQVCASALSECPTRAEDVLCVQSHGAPRSNRNWNRQRTKYRGGPRILCKVGS